MIADMQVFVLSIVQGLTEFLPISSSAHLILFPKIVGWADQGIAFDIAVHVGTLLAVLIYFRHEVMLMTSDWFGSIVGRGQTLNSKLAWAIGLGTIPVGIAGLLCKNIVATSLRSEFIIAMTTVGFGLLLGAAALAAKCQRDEYTINWKDVLVIGISQVLALIPGTSRSGVTITSGLMVGLTPQAAARYSFLLSIPVIALAGMLQTTELIFSGDIFVHWRVLFIGTTLSAISAYACIHVFLKLLDKIGFLPFVAYRLLLGVGLLVLFV